ncbi:MAG: hypothetical protein KF729_08705 [Sandaracinaceae bacterium]|nr:hypothetical protein [Sandaracinaceae bacterium]
MRHPSTLLACAVAIGCGGSGDGERAASAHVAGGEADERTPPGEPTEPAERARAEAPLAEVPFPAATIRDATPAGRTYVLQFREAGVVRYERWTFEEVDARGFTSTSTPVTETGEPAGPTERGEGTWEDLEAHAHFPADATEIRVATLALPLATFRCRLYTVTRPDDAGRVVVTRMWFADSLPGAPVRMVRERDGEVVLEMQLHDHVPPIR